MSSQHPWLLLFVSTRVSFKVFKSLVKRVLVHPFHSVRSLELDWNASFFYCVRSIVMPAFKAVSILDENGLMK